MGVMSWALPPLPPRLAAARHLPLVGRRRELETLESLWAEVVEGRRQVLFVGGEPSTGKTRLIAEVAARCMTTTWPCFSARRTSMLAFRTSLSSRCWIISSPPRGGRWPGSSSPEVPSFSGCQCRWHVISPISATRVCEQARFSHDLFNAVARLFRGLAEERPLALILDDLHWAQLPTLALLEHLVQACPDNRLLVVATFRTTAPDRSDEVAARVAELHRLDGVRRLDLSGLDTDAIAEYLSLRSGLWVGAARHRLRSSATALAGTPSFSASCGPTWSGGAGCRASVSATVCLPRSVILWQRGLPGWAAKSAR